ncbi:hypothetical protein FHR24_000357 [Wenyingzhuangia heitensis]|uniref:CarboxypepD_reg-like domain-containing protein n=1 Tax=Wenyingzhuangia heitensis TaxID=1487859 RepID=A0ABX0U4Y1_9FLAO|nr:carboxypeptidase-like regulatory domain-containing protein [Wenyingzhuangia heitensis]NIJ43918.1 hypothetical protein [Wenyingzhuangia heitensis]
MKTKLLILWILLSCSVFSQEKKIGITGKVVDGTDFGVAFTSVTISSTYIGTVCNDEGEFGLIVSEKHIKDTLEISTIGFKTLKVPIKDYLAQQEKKIVLKEDVVSLDEVQILSPEKYVDLARKAIKKTTLRKTHQLNILYRRFSTENHTSRFLVEHYIKALDRGMGSYQLDKKVISEIRKSGDYRFLKKKQSYHAIDVMINRHPIRTGEYRNGYEWKKTGGTTYDGEDIIILEGKHKKNKWKKITLYVGLDNYGIYKIETSDLDAVYLYKKHKNGKLFLSYHNREWKSDMRITDVQKKLLKINKNKIEVSYRHEAMVLNIETDRKKMDVEGTAIGNKDMGDYELPYNPAFWKELNMPPESTFYKKSVKELESIYKVSLEDQYKNAN